MMQQIQQIRRAIETLQRKMDRYCRYGIGGAVAATCKDSWVFWLEAATSGTFTVEITYLDSDTPTTANKTFNWDDLQSEVVTVLETISAIDDTYQVGGNLPADATTIRNTVTEGDRITSIRYVSDTLNSEAIFKVIPNEF